MFKMIALLKRRTDLSLDEFIDRYEKGHALFARPHMPNVKHYERRYLQSMANPVDGEHFVPDFDVITEIWFDNRADCEAAMGHVQTVAAEFAEDEANLFDRPATRLFTVYSEKT